MLEHFIENNISWGCAEKIIDPNNRRRVICQKMPRLKFASKNQCGGDCRTGPARVKMPTQNNEVATVADCVAEKRIDKFGADFEDFIKLKFCSAFEHKFWSRSTEDIFDLGIRFIDNLFFRGYNYHDYY